MTRYVLTLDLYIYTKDKREAQLQADAIIAKLKAKEDNHASQISLEEVPFGHINNEPCQK